MVFVVELEISYYIIRDFITITKYNLMDAERMIPYDKLRKLDHIISTYQISVKL